MGAKIGTASCPRHGVHDAALHVFYDWKVRYVRPVRKCSVVVFASFSKCGTGSVSCNSVFLLHLCRFLHQEALMEREAMVQNPSSHCWDLTGRKVHTDEIMYNPVHLSPFLEASCLLGIHI